MFLSINASATAPTWFLSALLHLSLIAPIFIKTYYRKPILGIVSIIAAIIFSLFASITPHFLFSIKPYLQIWDLDTFVIIDSKSFKWYHLTTNNYGTSFFVGIAFGYLFRKKVIFTRIQEILFWILSPVLMTGVILWHNTFYRLDKSAPLLCVLLWHSIGKLFCLGFAWILYVCCIGREGLYYLNS
jgi:hypothetical protein